MADLVDDIISNTDIVDIIGEYVSLKKSGSNYSGLCPFHNEKTPSFMVSPEKQIFKCFGCGKGGNSITFVKEIERVDFMDAIKILAPKANLDLTEYQKKFEKSDKNTSIKEKLKRINLLSQQYFSDKLKNSESARKYLKNNRNLSNEIIQKFQLGYAPDNFFDLINYLKTKGFNNQDMLDASITKLSEKKENYSFFRNRITFPIIDTMQNIVGFSARVINSEDKPKYLNSSENVLFEKSKILYGLNFVKENIKKFEKIIVVEGQMDVIGLARLNYPVGVATCGTALTKYHIKILKRYTDNIYIMFDNDQAGIKASIRALKIAYQNDLFPKLIILPSQYKDLDELANQSNGEKIFSESLTKSKDGFIAIFELLRKESDLNSPIDKQKLFNQMFELIVGIDNPGIQMHFLSLLAEKVGQSLEVIKSQYTHYARGEGSFVIKQLQKKQDKQKIYQPDRENIFWALFFEDFLDKFIDDKEYKNLLNNIKNSLEKFVLQEKNLDSELLKESQLWREKEIQSKDNNSIKKQISTTILPLLKTYLQQIQKINNISFQDKQNLFKQIQKISN